MLRAQCTVGLLKRACTTPSGSSAGHYSYTKFFNLMECLHSVKKKFKSSVRVCRVSVLIMDAWGIQFIPCYDRGTSFGIPRFRCLDSRMYANSYRNMTLDMKRLMLLQGVLLGLIGAIHSCSYGAIH